MYSIIIVDFNSLKVTMQYIEDCLEKIEERKELHFVVVDNKPNSTSCHILEREMGLNIQKKVYKGLCVLCFDYHGAEVRVIQVRKNVGYARGNNIGIEFSDREWADSYLILSNNDIEFRERVSLTKLSRILDETDRAAVVGPHIEDVSGRRQGPYDAARVWDSLIVRPTKMLMRLVFGKKENKRTSQEANYPNGECDWVSGCFLVCAREKMRYAGNFDENTFLYGEEMILSERLKKVGYAMFYCDDVKIIHRGSETIARNFKDLEAEEVLFQSLFYYFKNYRKTNRVVLGLSWIYFQLIRICFGVGKKVNHIFKMRTVE
ncbi:MAG: glycosyltransferase family 2 protein [Lachnospiraceae bacterium]|nr:glycosyltransferase family 2 protein [Lachnospiraceae bacterium]